MAQPQQPIEQHLTANTVPSVNTNMTNSPILIANNHDNEIPGSVKFLMGLMIPVLLLIIPFTLFSIEDSLGDELKFSYGESHFIVTLDNVNSTEYSGNFSEYLEDAYNDTRIIDCAIETMEYGGDFEEIDGRLAQPNYPDRIYQHSCKPYLITANNSIIGENHSIISVLNTDSLSTYPLLLDSQKNSPVTYSMNLSDSEKVAIASLKLTFQTENETPDDTYYLWGQTSNNFSEIRKLLSDNESTNVGYIYQNGSVEFNNTENIEIIIVEYISIRTIGYWSEEGHVQFDDGNDYGHQLNIAFATVSDKLRIDNELSDNELMSTQRDVASLGYLSCCGVLTSSLICTIYGFASRNGIPMAFGGIISFIICPILFVIPPNIS